LVGVFALSVWNFWSDGIVAIMILVR